MITLATTEVTAWRTYPRVEVALVAPIGVNAPAAASRNHLFISTGSALVTLDANTLQRRGALRLARRRSLVARDRRRRASLCHGRARRCTCSRRRPAGCSTRARARSRSPAAMSCFTRRILSRTKSRHRFSRPRQRGRAAGCHNRGWRRSSDRSSGARRRTPAACSMFAATRQSRSRVFRSRCSRSPRPRSSRRDPRR